MKYRHLFPAFCSAVLLASPAVQAKEWDRDMSQWDHDGNGQVTLQEWDTAIEEQGLFEELDDNNNGMYDIQESLNGYPDYDVAMDLDDGGHIERQEFTVGWFNSFDENDDDMLDAGEFDQFNSSYDAAATTSN